MNNHALPPRASLHLDVIGQNAAVGKGNKSRLGIRVLGGPENRFKLD